MPLTVSEAMNILERAYLSRNPNEIEKNLRDMLNIRVAVVSSLEGVVEKINEGYYPITVTIPYGVFLGKIRERKIEVYLFDFKTIKEGIKPKIVRRSEILPNKTYILFKKDAGYSRKMGLTFEGEGEVTGFERLNDAEKVEKYGVGKEQTWEEHARGACNRVKRILKIYEPFMEDWFRSVFKGQALDEDSIKESIRAIMFAIKVSVLFHDIGKLRKEWQDSVGWRMGQPYIGRTKEKHNVPFHAPYAYPFLGELLSELFGDFRFLDAIALAVARHHSLEVTGRVKQNKFQLADEDVFGFLCTLLKEALELELEDMNNLDKILKRSIEQVNKGSTIDEPPSLSDDFYFIYTLTNRVVKFADWEDASDSLLELADLGGGDNDTS